MTNQLKECIASGQVSAAQVVAHAEAGEFVRSCTCHPYDNPPMPCAKQYALNDCKVVALTAALEAEREKVRSLTLAAKGVAERYSRLTHAELEACPRLGIYLLHAAITATQEPQA
jgi:hypothetical protein